MLVRVVKNWDSPDLFQQMPTDLKDSNICFTLDEVDDCDVLIILNYLKQPIQVNCPADNIWAIMQEPYIPGVFGWMVEKHEAYAQVFTHSPPNAHLRYHAFYPALPWHVNKSYQQLVDAIVPTKTKTISWITSNKLNFPGHKKRMQFYQFLKSQNQLSVDFFGKGIQFIEDKWDALAPYSYALAIENSTTTHYWTEKLADCFLSYTLPFYYGCQNIEDYFPKDSFILIDITKPNDALHIIQTAIENKEWEKRFEAIKEARQLILNRYNFFHFVKARIEELKVSSLNKKQHQLDIYKPSINQKCIKKITGLKNKIYTSISQ